MTISFWAIQLRRAERWPGWSDARSSGKSHITNQKQRKAKIWIHLPSSSQAPLELVHCSALAHRAKMMLRTTATMLIPRAAWATIADIATWMTATAAAPLATDAANQAFPNGRTDPGASPYVHPVTLGKGPNPPRFGPLCVNGRIEWMASAKYH